MYRDYINATIPNLQQAWWTPRFTCSGRTRVTDSGIDVSIDTLSDDDNIANASP